MRNRFSSPFGPGGNMGDYYKRLYQQNKVLIWITLGLLITMWIAGASFINAFLIAYLIFISGILYQQYFKFEKMLMTMTLSLLSGALLYLLLFHERIEVESALPALIGSAAFGLLAALGTHAPNSYLNLALIGRVKMKWIVLVLIGLDLLTVNPSNPSPRISHLGGVLYGFLSVYFANQLHFSGFNFSRWFKKPGPYYKRPREKKQSTYTPPKAAREKDEDYNVRKKQEQKEIDAILDKIKKSGYESLSSEEKKRLFEQSNR